MISVEDKNTIKRALNHRVDDIVFARCCEHHAQEVAGIRQAILWINIGLTLRVLISHRHQSWHLGNQTNRSNVTMMRIRDVVRVVIERRHRANKTCQNGHRMRIAAKTAQEKLLKEL